MSNYKKILKKSFKHQLALALNKYLTEQNLLFDKEPKSVESCHRRLVKTSNLEWAQLTKLLYHYDKWIRVELVDYGESKS